MKPLQKIDPNIKPPSTRADWASATELKARLEEAGFREIEVHEVVAEVNFQSHSTFVDILLTKMPHLVALTREFSEERAEHLRNLMIEETRKFSPTQPGVLKGTALIALGRK
jgi:hypothetical protein